MKITVVIPSYNEAKNIQSGVLDSVYEYLKIHPSIHCMIVDDGSTDNTRELVKKYIAGKPMFSLLENPHGGKAITVMSGLLKSTADITLFSDMDQAAPITEIDKILPFFDQGFDIVIGSRQGREGAPLLRKVSAAGFALLRNIILGLPFKDTQCGLKAFNKSAIQSVFPKLLENWQSRASQSAAVNAGFDIEVLFIARKKGLKIKEVGIDWHHVGTERVQIVKDAIEAISDMLRIRLDALSGKYK